jgi:hypothetical protein
MNNKECVHLRRSEDGLIKFCDSREIRAATGRCVCAFAQIKDCLDCMFYEIEDDMEVEEDDPGIPE